MSSPLLAIKPALPALAVVPPVGAHGSCSNGGYRKGQAVPGAARCGPLGLNVATKIIEGAELSSSSAESFAKSALSPNKTTDEKIELIAKVIVELAKTIGSMERDISRVKIR